MSNLNLNKVILAGRLTSDVELKQTTTGVSVCSFTLAINRKFSANGQQQTDFIQCQAWRQTAEFISKYFKKGSALCISGSIQVRSWTDSNNQKRYATEVVAEEAMFVDGKNDSQGAELPNYEEMNEDDDVPF
jgi:single-strand DNA-binding protein